MKTTFEMKNIKNSTLLIIFGLLVVISAAVYFYDRNKGERSFKSELFSIDSSSVTSIKIYAKGKSGEVLMLEGSGKNWHVKFKNKSYPADTSTIQQLIGAIRRAIPERVAGTDQSAWKELEITDSASTRVVVDQGNVTVAYFRVGKLSMSQSSQGSGYGGRQGMTVKSHIRVAGDERVYVVDGFLSMMFRNEPSLYRNRMVCRFDKNLVTKLTFVYPGDSSFVMQKQGTMWMIGDRPADSVKTMTFINSLANAANNEFADESNMPVTFPYQLRVDGNSMPAVELNGAVDNAARRYFVKSSMNPGAVFGSASPSLFNQVFPGNDKFSLVKQIKEPKKR